MGLVAVRSDRSAHSTNADHPEAKAGQWLVNFPIFSSEELRRLEIGCLFHHALVRVCQAFVHE